MFVVIAREATYELQHQNLMHAFLQSSSSSLEGLDTFPRVCCAVSVIYLMATLFNRLGTCLDLPIAGQHLY